MSLEGRTALITGASRGIGAACARELRARGCKVVITYHHDDGNAAALAQELGLEAYRMDLRDRPATRDVAARIEAEQGPVHILVHNAGIIRDALLPLLSEEAWDEIYEVNLRGAFLLTRLLVKGMLKERWGRVISIASLSGVAGQPGQTHYSAAKGGLIAFTKALSKEVATYGVTANAIAPGFIETDMLSGLSAAKREQYRLEIPLRRFGEPEEVAAAVGFLASPQAAYITGQTLRIDGGLMTA